LRGQKPSISIPPLCGLFIRRAQRELNKISNRGFHHLDVQWDDDFPAPDFVEDLRRTRILNWRFEESFRFAADVFRKLNGRMCPASCTGLRLKKPSTY